MYDPKRIIKVEEIMTTRVITIDPLATVREAAARMRREKLTCLVVDKRSPEDARGILALLDLARGVIAPGRDPDITQVYEVMTKPVITVRPELDVRHVAALFVNLKLRRAPVTDGDDNLVGMISLSDLVLKGSDIL